MMSVEMSTARHFPARKLLGRNERASPRHQQKLRTLRFGANVRTDQGQSSNGSNLISLSRSSERDLDMCDHLVLFSCVSPDPERFSESTVTEEGDKGSTRCDCHWRLVKRVIVALTCHDTAPLISGPAELS